MAVAIDRREGVGVGVAVIGHAALFALLSLTIMPKVDPLDIKPTPIEVSLTDEAGLVSEAPVIETEAPAERLAEVPAPPEPNSPPPVPETQPEPVAKPDPTPPKAAPAPAPKPQPKAEAKKSNPAPAKAQQKTERQAVRPTGRLTGITDGLTDQASKGKATTPQAAQMGPEVRSSIFGLIRRQVKPHWRAPTGADVNLLATIVEVRLNRDGSLAGQPRVVQQNGQTASNRPQQELHKERALAAIRLAAPFRGLPEEYYDGWKAFRLSFDRRL